MVAGLTLINAAENLFSQPTAVHPQYTTEDLTLLFRTVSGRLYAFLMYI